MPSDREDRAIWAKWRVDEAGGVRVVVTYREGDGFTRRELSFESLERAAAELGQSFREVVEKVLEEGGHTGRWRP